MGKWVEYKPGGIVETNVLDEENDILLVNKAEDVEPLLDRNAELRNTGATDRGIKSGFWHYASIPITIQYELLKKGLSICNKHHYAAIFEEINKNYPYLKTTAKTHSEKRSRPKKKATTTEHGPYVIVR